MDDYNIFVPGTYEYLVEALSFYLDSLSPEDLDTICCDPGSFFNSLFTDFSNIKGD